MAKKREVSVLLAGAALLVGALTFMFSPSSGDDSVQAAERGPGGSESPRIRGKADERGRRSQRVVVANTSLSTVATADGESAEFTFEVPVETVRIGVPTLTIAPDQAPVSATGLPATTPHTINDGGSTTVPSTTSTTASITTSTAPAQPTTPLSSTTSRPTSTETSSTPPTSPERRCSSGDGPRIEIVGSQSEQYRNTGFADGSFFDAGSADWSGRAADGTPIPWLVTLRSSGGLGRGSCWVGGFLRGPWDDTAPGVSWEDPYHHAGGFTIDVPDLTVEDVRIENQGDGIHIVDNGSNASLRSILMRDIHDDCIENDSLHTLSVDNVLLDGCYVAFSARPHSLDSTPDRSGNVWTITNSLVRLEPQPTVYRGPAPGHGGFFKWDTRAPKLSIHNTIFRVDQQANHGTLGIPSSVEMHSCSNNIVVWLGGGDYPGDLPACFSVTTDVSVWNNSVAAWRP